MSKTTHKCRTLDCWMSHTDYCLKGGAFGDFGRLCTREKYHAGVCDRTLKMVPKMDFSRPSFWRTASIVFVLSFLVGFWLV